ncbi:MAG TPA: (d)CMP kinase [Geminicoccaceae bacterium]|nr:(d)CMP kinase [Geminicoccus sp.]HMU50861.1 (d)CMP kinase [Geminicoccaceae bacterium]
MSPLVIAVDGPAASGKSTLARRIADHYGLPFLDTGLLYRAVGRRVLAAGGDPGDETSATEAALALAPADVDAGQLRGEGTGQAASKVAAFPSVRAALLPFQRNFAATPPGAVLAGRDVGTVICPEATLKVFVTATVEERARRRFEELRQRGDPTIYAAVLEELRERDRRDQDRAVAPLRPAPDAWVLDTTDLDADAAFEAVRAGIDRLRR